MGGGLMQLVAYGAQDVYLTGNPQITFWKVTYRRYTNFAMESIEQTFNGQADFGRRVTCTISRNGDLAYRTYLQVTLPEINQQMLPAGVTPEQMGGLPVGAQNKGLDYGVFARWLDFPGEQMVSMVEVEIGGQRIDRQYGDWMHIWNQLTLLLNSSVATTKWLVILPSLPSSLIHHSQQLMVPALPLPQLRYVLPVTHFPETTLYVPFQFWYCRNPGLALPLIALQYHEIKINLDLRPIDECLWAVSSLTNNCTGAKTPTKVATAYQQSLVAASLYVDYVFLDTDERRRMAQNPHEYLIEQLQFTGDESVGSSSNKIKLNFNHPCKELIWVVQPDANVDYCASLICGTQLFSVLGAQPFNYTDAIDVLPNGVHAFAGPGSVEGKNAFITTAGLFEQAGATDAVTFPGWEYSAPNFNSSSDLAASTAPSPRAPTISSLQSLMLAHSFSPRHHLTCTAGVRIQSLQPNFSLTARTASQSVRAHTSTLSSPTSTTPVILTLVSMYTPSPSGPRSTSHQAPAISHALTMPHFSLFFPMLPLAVPTLPRFASMPPTTMSSELCPVWVVSPTLTKLLFLFFSLSSYVLA